MTTEAMTIDQAYDQLTELGAWVRNEQMPGLADLYGKYRVFEVTTDQFQTIQQIVSGARFGETLEESVDFLEGREWMLHEEADENDTYQLNYPHCSSGFFKFESGFLSLWYETTSGTLLSQWFKVRDEGLSTSFEVCIPHERCLKGKGNHHYEIVRVISGMTLEMYQRWNNSSSILGKETDYDEMSRFHNEKMVPNGWAPIKTLQQLKMTRDINHALRHVYGTSGLERGIGEQIRSILGPDGEFNAGMSRPCLSGANRLLKAEEILSELETATARFKQVCEKWADESGLSFADFRRTPDEDCDDYKGDETDFE